MTEGSNPDDGADVTLEELLALRDGELSIEDEANLLARVRASERATAMLDELDQTDEILGRIRNKPRDPEVVAGIEQAIAQAEAGRHGEPSGEQVHEDQDQDRDTEPDA